MYISTCVCACDTSTPNRVSVGSITKAQLEEIATIKLPDLNTTKLSSAITSPKALLTGLLAPF